MIILGLSYNYHDAAACIVRNGVPIAAAEEERFSRQKHDTRFPERAIAYCLHEAGIAPANARLRPPRVRLTTIQQLWLLAGRIGIATIHPLPLSIGGMALCRAVSRGCLNRISVS